MSSPAEASEIAADRAARQAVAGEPVRAGGNFAVAATQRQPKGEGVGDLSDKDIEIEIITAYLNRVAKANPRQNLKQLKVVRAALKMLLVDTAGKGTDAKQPTRFMDVDKFLDASVTPSDADELAKRFAADLPPIPKSALDRLSSFAVTDDEQSRVERVGDVVKKSKPGGGDANPVPGDVNPKDKAEDINRRLGGGPTHIFDADVLRFLRIWSGLGSALNPPKKPAPRGDLDETVAATIDTIDKGALLPAEAKGKGADSGAWIEDAQAFAVALAQKIDLAQKKSQDEVSISLPAAYGSVKDRAGMMEAIKGIVEKLRDARSDHASNIKRVIVRVGDSTRVWLVVTI